jgi:hypothetical protein
VLARIGDHKIADFARCCHGTGRAPTAWLTPPEPCEADQWRRSSRVHDGPCCSIFHEDDQLDPALDLEPEDDSLWVNGLTNKKCSPPSQIADWSIGVFAETGRRVSTHQHIWRRSSIPQQLHLDFCQAGR